MVMCRALGEENVFWRRNQRLKDNGQDASGRTFDVDLADHDQISAHPVC
jgi:hypothetical protein